MLTCAHLLLYSLPDVPESIESPIPKRLDRSTSAGALSSSPNMRSKRSGLSLRSTESSYQTQITTPSPPPQGLALPPLQAATAEYSDGLEPLCEEEVEPGSFDLVLPETEEPGLYSLEERSEFLFSAQHLRIIFDDFALYQRFATFMSTHRPKSIPLLVYYLDTVKALAAFRYANAISEAVEPLDAYDFTRNAATVPKAVNDSLERKADTAFEVLAQEDLPAFITSVWMEFVEISIRRRIVGSMPAHLKEYVSLFPLPAAAAF